MHSILSTLEFLSVANSCPESARRHSPSKVFARAGNGKVADEEGEKGSEKRMEKLPN